MQRGADGGRLAWVDVAKGLAIVLVVLHHAVVWLDAAGWMPPTATALNWQLASFRMPVFFFASGLFAAATLRASWRTVLHKRVAFFAWLYLLWATAAHVVFTSTPLSLSPLAPHGVTGWVRLFLVPQAELWFIYGLALYSVVTKLILRLPAAVQLGGAGLVAVLTAAGVIPTPGWAWANMISLYPFFLLGLHFRPLAQRVAERATLPLTLLAVVTYAAASAAVAVWEVTLPGVGPVVGVIAVVAGIHLTAVLAPTPVGRVLGSVGQRTLPIYLLHLYWIGLLVNAIYVGPWQPGPAVACVMALALTGTAIPVALRVHRATARVDGLFSLPARWAWKPSTATLEQSDFGLGRAGRWTA